MIQNYHITLYKNIYNYISKISIILSSTLIISNLPFIHVFSLFLFLNSAILKFTFIYLCDSLSHLCALSLSRKRQYYVTFYEYRCVIHRDISLLRETPTIYFMRKPRSSHQCIRRQMHASYSAKIDTERIIK